MKKYCFAVLVLFVTIKITIVSPVYGDQWSPTEDWGPQDGSYSPDWGRTVMYEYTDSAWNLYVSPQTRFRFTQDAIDAIKNYYSNHFPKLYYTFDISVSDPYNTTVTALNTTMYSSTLPTPHFDRDDDPEESGGNGWYDETEVTTLDPLSMLANTDYRFDSRFRVYDTDQITFEFTSQMSYEFFGEYETYVDENNIHYFDWHISRNYPWY